MVETGYMFTEKDLARPPEHEGSGWNMISVNSRTACVESACQSPELCMSMMHVDLDVLTVPSRALVFVIRAGPGTHPSTSTTVISSGSYGEAFCGRACFVVDFLSPRAEMADAW